MVAGAVIYASTYVISGLISHLPSGCYIVLLINFFISIPLTGGWWFLLLQLVRGNPAKLLDIFTGFYCFLRVWLTSILTTIILLIGLVLFLVPGIIWVLKYGLSIFATMDKELAPHKALEFSSIITDGYKSKLFLLLLISLVLFPIEQQFPLSRYL